MHTCNSTQCSSISHVEDDDYDLDDRHPLGYSMLVVSLLLAGVCGIFLFVILILKIYELRARRRTNSASQRRGNTGLKASEIQSLPTFKFSTNCNSHLHFFHEEAMHTDCSICLGDFLEGHLLRVLPSCRHAFHIQCIDTWLSNHHSCPTCRGEVLTSVDGKTDRVMQLEILIANHLP
ncbi:hypothetical protein GOP47_0001223 [Adiantum capillus-veneris]|uniref:RING-type domain-containing protein n=1 Tax=Adiantum capillus-veneris TaxID=13818 RepID=A0A9D4VFD7_ADICA|nr:hypothetical protein GOP47_0001223 [Adiantum capillus-veneris]